MRVRPTWIPLLGLVLFVLFVASARAEDPVSSPAPAVATAQDGERERPLTPVKDPAPDTSYVEPWAVAGRSLLVPGWGQFRLGDDAWGTSYLFSALLGAAFGLEVVQFGSSENSRSFQRTMGWIQYGFSAVVSGTKAYQAAEQRNRENGWLLEARRGMDGGPLVAATWRF